MCVFRVDQPAKGKSVILATLVAPKMSTLPAPMRKRWRSKMIGASVSSRAIMLPRDHTNFPLIAIKRLKTENTAKAPRILSKRPNCKGFDLRLRRSM